MIDTKRTSAVVYLMPEWVALLANLLVFYQYEVTGFITMIVGMFVMGIILIWQAAQQLFALSQVSDKSSTKNTATNVVELQIV